MYNVRVLSADLTETEAGDIMILKGLTCITVFVFTLIFPGVSGAAQDVFTIDIGDFKVSMLSERQRESDSSILIGMSDAEARALIPSGKYPSSVSAFLIRAPHGVYLVDTGFGEKLFQNMASLGVEPEDVTCLLLTHSHGDHIGGMVRDGKATLPNARVYVSIKEEEWSQPLRNNLAAYECRVEKFEPIPLGTPARYLVEGITAIAAYGHTPGHTIYLLESRGSNLLIWGDLTHAMAVQIPRPDISVTYDSGPAEAAATRKAVLKYVSENNIAVAGMHIAYPAIGMVKEDESGTGQYKYTSY